MKRLPMRKIKDVLRLQAEGFSTRQIASSTGIGRSTVGEYLLRARKAGLHWPLCKDQGDDELAYLLYPARPHSKPEAIPTPDFVQIHRELRRKGVTLFLLWEEYRQVYPEGYCYSQFCALYSKWRGKLSPTMRQPHPAGERLFVDYAGNTFDIVDPGTGEIRTAQIFIAVLGASSYTYVEASWTQTLPDWIASHVRAFAFFGGVPAQVVCDNLKSGISKACFHEPAINRSYADMASHYGCAIIPARPRKPKDKAKVEVGVQIVERWILAKLRNRQVFGLDELNTAIRPLLDAINGKTTRHLGASRRDLFEQVDKPALKALPAEPYVYAEWKQCRAGLDYHVEIAKHYYSVPWQLIKQQLWARITARTIEIYFKGKRVASHLRSSGNRRHSTVSEHMPSHHRYRADWSPQRLRKLAAKTGPNTETFVNLTMRQRRHPEQAFRSCMGVLRLVKTYGPERVEAACERALEINAYSYTSVQSILEKGLDRRPRQRSADGPPITHPNIRGADYFH